MPVAALVNLLFDLQVLELIVTIGIMKFILAVQLY